MSYELIKSYYELGLFTKNDLEMFVSIGWIKETQRKELIKQTLKAFKGHLSPFYIGGYINVKRRRTKGTRT